MTPRSIAIARTSGEPAPSTNIPPAVPIEHPPCGPTTGWCSGPCSTTPVNLPGACPVGTALFPEIPVASSSPGLRSHRVFRTKCELVVELIREQGTTGGRHLGIFDGAYALRSVVRALGCSPSRGTPASSSRPGCGRTLGLRPAATRVSGQPEMGPPVATPLSGGAVVGTVAGGRRLHLWSAAAGPLEGTGVPVGVAGAEVPVKVVVAEVEGYRQRFYLVSSATELTGVEMVEGFAGRFRQEDVFRDLRQRLGREECRAWTQAPIERTSQVQWVTLSLLRLAQFRLEAEGSTDWWLRPPWNRKKDRPSVLDVERLLRRHGSEIRNLLAK